MELVWCMFEAVDRTAVKACEGLALRGYEVFRPMILVYSAARRARSRRPIHQKRETRAKRWEPRFGSCAFIRLDRASVGAQSRERWELRRLRDRSGAALIRDMFTCAGGDSLAQVPDEWIDFYRADTRADGKTRPPLAPGETVQRSGEVGDVLEIIRGPFAGLRGVIEKVDSAEVLTIGVAIFGRCTPIKLEVWHTRPSEMCLT